jgi:hypothetical protein
MTTISDPKTSCISSTNTLALKIATEIENHDVSPLTEMGYLKDSPDSDSPSGSPTAAEAKEQKKLALQLEEKAEADAEALFVLAKLDTPPATGEVNAYQYNCNTVMLYRIFRGSVQRVDKGPSSLKSYASFIVVDDKNEALIIWHGCICEEEDKIMATGLALRVVTLEYKQTQFSEEDLPTIVEGEEKPGILNVFYKMMNCGATAYSSKVMISARREQFSNSSSSCGVICPYNAAPPPPSSPTGSQKFGSPSSKSGKSQPGTPSSSIIGKSKRKSVNNMSPSRSFFEEVSMQVSDDGFVLREFAHNDVDASGSVARLPFLPDVTDRTVVYVCVGHQWDIWAARGVSLESLSKAILCVENVLLKQLHMAHSAEMGPEELREVLSRYEIHFVCTTFCSLVL